MALFFHSRCVPFATEHPFFNMVYWTPCEKTLVFFVKYSFSGSSNADLIFILRYFFNLKYCKSVCLAVIFQVIRKIDRKKAKFELWNTQKYCKIILINKPFYTMLCYAFSPLIVESDFIAWETYRGFDWVMCLNLPYFYEIFWKLCEFTLSRCIFSKKGIIKLLFCQSMVLSTCLHWED